jgi:quercetin dioxygenase-like cupin family protein
MSPMSLYNWNAIAEEQLNPRLSRRVIHTQSMTIARLLLLKYATVPEHSHVHEQVTMVERGALKFILDGREQIVRGGEALTILPNSRHSVEALEDSVVTDVFSPAREDWIRGDDAYLRR